MKKFKTGLIVAAVIIIIAELFIIGYSHWVGSKNIGNYLVILGMVLLITGQVLPFKNEKRKKEKITE